MKIKRLTSYKNAKTSIKFVWLLICFFVALFTNQNAFKAEECLLYFNDDTSILLYKDADESSDVLGKCLNNLVLEVLDSPNDEWIHVRIGTIEENIEGYVASSYIFDVQSPVFNQLNCTNVQSNSKNIAVGTGVYSCSGEIKGYIPNGDSALVYVDMSDGRCFVRYWSYEQNQLEFGYVNKTDLTPFDGSNGSYPLDRRIPLNGFTYTFQSLWPDDLYHDLSGFEILRQDPIVGGIAANGGMQAFVVTHDDLALHFYSLTKVNGVWKIESKNDSLLYQDSSYPPKLISFSRDAKEVWIKFSEDEHNRIHLLGFAKITETDQWILQNAVYVSETGTTTSIIRENDMYYYVHNEIGDSIDRQIICIRKEDMLLNLVCMYDLERILNK